MPVAELVGLGAQAAASPSELGERCSVIEIAVWDDADVETVVAGHGSHGGILSSARPGTIVAVHSTISLATCYRLADAASRRGVRVVDAAMSGGQARALDGSLAIMVGGAAEDFEACKDLLEVVGEQVFHVGPLGTGMAAKLCNNLMVLANLQTVTEALGIATAAGIDPEKMIEVAAAGTADSWALRHGYALQQQGQRMSRTSSQAQRSPRAGSQVQMQIKDLELAAMLARELGMSGNAEITEFFLARARGR